MSETITSKIHWRDYLDSLNLNLDESKECEKCRREQIEKHGKITISCTGMTTSEESLGVSKEDVGEELFGLLQKEADVVSWSRRTFINKITEEPLVKDRVYQRLMNNCTAKNKVYRCGRRVGKTAAMVMEIAENMIKHPGYKVLVVTPFKSQAEEIYLGLRSYFANVAGIDEKDVIKRAKESPAFSITLQNESRMKAFTTGSSGGGQIRGQGADKIYIDEIDYLSEKDFNSVMAILADTPDTKLTVASTPDGEKMLFKLAKTANYKEFHFPTFVLPHYNDELDASLRSTTDDIGYVQEFMAEFGSSRSSVFQKQFIDLAVSKNMKPELEDVFRNRQNYILSLGCDWNHVNVGTRICISALDKSTGIMAPIHYDNIAVEGWTQLSAINKIIELNRIYSLDHMYVDEGFGYAQIEMIKRYSMEQRGKVPVGHPDLNLVNITPVNFSSTLKVIDPVDNREKNKYMKQYIVETVVEFFAESVISLNKGHDDKLIEELTGYIIKGETSNGRLVYAASSSKVGDHNLDAFMLSIYGLHAEYSSILRRRGFYASIIEAEHPSRRNTDSDTINTGNNPDLIYNTNYRSNNHSKGRADRLFDNSNRYSEQRTIRRGSRLW